MPKFTDEQVQRAKNVDVRTFLEQTEGYTFEGHGRFLKCQNPQRTNQPSSLSIDTEMNRIYYNSITGNRPLSAVDWCMQIKNMDFKSSMNLVLGENPQGERIEKPKYTQHISQPKAAEYEPKNLELSERSDTSIHAKAYLIKTRCIPENIVNDCVNKNLIYEDVRRNAVFVGYDSENKIPKYAARRGTFTPDGKEPFKRDCTGSDKNFAFRLEGKNTETVYVAEAAIDVLSLAALEDKFHGKGAYKEKTYLSTGGAGMDKALEQFCNTHDVKTINVCFDDDEAGKNGMEKIMQKFRERGYNVNDMRASLAHDYNDELVAFSNDPNFYSKPPDVVVNTPKITIERSDTMSERNMTETNKNEYIENALNEIVSHYDVLYTRDDLNKLPENDKIHIADMYSQRPFDETNTDTYAIDSNLNGDILQAININEFKGIINANKLREQGIEIEDINLKSNIRNDFYYEPSMSFEDLEFAFDETISSISFKNQDKETVTFRNYYDLKIALSDPDSILMRSGGQVEREDFIPFDDYSISDEKFLNQQQFVQQEVEPLASPEPEHILEKPLQNPEKDIQEKPTAPQQKVQQEINPLASSEPEHIPEKPLQNPEKDIQEKPTAPQQKAQQEVNPVASSEPEHIPEKPLQNRETDIQEKPAAPQQKAQQEVNPVASSEPEHIPEKPLQNRETDIQEKPAAPQQKAQQEVNPVASSEPEHIPEKPLQNSNNRNSQEQPSTIKTSDVIFGNTAYSKIPEKDFISGISSEISVNLFNRLHQENIGFSGKFSNNGLTVVCSKSDSERINRIIRDEINLLAKRKEQEIVSPIPIRTSKEEKLPEIKPETEIKKVEPISVDKLTGLSSTEKTNVLLASLRTRQEKKRAELLDKIDIIDVKISDRQERINKLNSKIADIEMSLKTSAAFKRFFGNSIIGSLIDKNIEKKQAKIKQIKEEKIPKQEEKIKRQTDKKAKKTAKLGKVNRKIEKIDKVQDFLSALGSKDKDIRHKGFITGLENLSDIKRENLENKLSKIQTRIDMLSANISSPDLSNINRLKIKSEIRNLHERSSDISAKINDIHNLRNDLDNMKNGGYTETAIDVAVNATADKISQRLDETAVTENTGIVNHIISQAVESGSESVSEVTVHKSAERAEKVKPDLERERIPEDREPEVTVNTEQQILTSIAALTGVSISEINRLPFEMKADIIAEFRENNGNMPTEKLAEVICETINIKSSVHELNKPENDIGEQKVKENDTHKTFEENIRNNTISDNTKKEYDKPLFSRSAIMSDKYKPTSSKSADDIERDRQNRNKQAEL